MNTDLVIVAHEGKRLGIHPSLSHALQRLRRYPKQAEVIRVHDGAHLATRISPFAMPRRIVFPAKPGQGEGAAGVGRMPSFETVSISQRFAA